MSRGSLRALVFTVATFVAAAGEADAAAKPKRSAAAPPIDVMVLLAVGDSSFSGYGDWRLHTGTDAARFREAIVLNWDPTGDCRFPEAAPGWNTGRAPFVSPADYAAVALWERHGVPVVLVRINVDGTDSRHWHPDNLVYQWFLLHYRRFLADLANSPFRVRQRVVMVGLGSVDLLLGMATSEPGAAATMARNLEATMAALADQLDLGPEEPRFLIQVNPGLPGAAPYALGQSLAARAAGAVLVPTNAPMFCPPGSGNELHLNLQGCRSVADFVGGKHCSFDGVERDVVAGAGQASRHLPWAAGGRRRSRASG